MFINKNILLLKMAKKRDPDFLGYWVIDKPLDDSWDGNYGSFFMFVDVRETISFPEHSENPNRTQGFLNYRNEIQKGLDEIRGRIEDKFGLAKFTGRISKDRVIFTKQYIDGETFGEVCGLPIEYNGKGNGDGFYQGVWKNTTPKAENPRKGVFVLEDYVYSRTLNFLVERENQRWRGRI